MNKRSNKFSPEVRERAVRMVQEHRGEYPSLSAAAHFSDRGRLFQADRGRRFSAIVDARGLRASEVFNVSQTDNG